MILNVKRLLVSFSFKIVLIKVTFEIFQRLLLFVVYFLDESSNISLKKSVLSILRENFSESFPIA